MLNLLWPVPALFAWACAWGLFLGAVDWGLSPAAAMTGASALGIALTRMGSNWWRRLLIGLGFPLSLAVSGLASVPSWGWLVPLALLLLIYPLNAWRDAPLFPTPAHSLRELPRFAPLPQGALVLDAGCGLGDGLIALRQAYPQSRLYGLEWSWPLRAACALRCPWAHVRKGDIWRADWRPYEMVYLFQRPESMPRATKKALQQLQPGAWLVSLEFEAPALRPHAALVAPDGRPVWLYQAPFHTKEPIAPA
jgi:SAM-dependent methyltransferase